MKAPTLKTKKSILDKKKTADKFVVTELVISEELVKLAESNNLSEVVTNTGQAETKPTYILTAEMNSGLYISEGEGMDVFSKIEKPPKYTTKGIFTLKNRLTGKSFEIVYPPYLTRKLLINPFVQTVQWKRMSAKVD